MKEKFTAFQNTFPPFPDKACRKTIRETVLRILEKNEYGLFPAPPLHLDASTVALERSIFAGKGEYEKVNLLCEFEKRSAEYSIDLLMPSEGAESIFIYLFDSKAFSSRLLPYEGIIDSHCGIAMLDINSIAEDNDKTRGFASILTKDKRTPCRTGKYMIWAWAIIRAAEFLSKRWNYLKIGAIADSHLAASALLSAAKSDIIDFVCVNGIHPSALMPLCKTDCDDMYRLVERFGGRYCPKFTRLVNEGKPICFDTHFLASLIYPRKLLVSIAENEYPYSKDDLLAALMQTRELYSDIVISENKENCETAHIVLNERAGTRGLTKLDWDFYLWAKK